MAWTLDQATVISTGSSTSSTTLAVTTSNTVAVGGWIFMLVGSDLGTVSTVSLGGLSWGIAANLFDGSQIVTAVVYAYAASGLASATAGTITYTAASAHKSCLASSFTGGPTSLTPSTASSATGSTAAWTTGTGPAAGAAGDLVFGGIDRATNVGTNTPDGNTTELQDTANVGGSGTNILSAYRIASAAGNMPLGGTYSGAAGYLAAAASFPAPVVVAPTTVPITPGSGVGVDTTLVGSDQRQIVHWGSAPTAAETNVTSAAADTTLLAANLRRIGVTVYNDSLQTLYIKYGSGASSASFTVRLSSGAFWEMPQPIYTGAINGNWTSADGFARVTEMTF
jgi:hypothetical protein